MWPGRKRRQIEGCTAGKDPASIRCWISDIEDRILEQKREIDIAIAQVLDILDYLPIHSTERQICELWHIDFKPWGAISAEIPMSRSQVYRRYRAALDALLENQRVQAVMKNTRGNMTDTYAGGQKGAAARETFQKRLTFADSVFPFAEKCGKRADSVV